jgi:hypothetical protein
VVPVAVPAVAEGDAAGEEQSTTMLDQEHNAQGGNNDGGVVH